MNLFSLQNKTAIVTGACGLIGKEHCRALHEAGANVVVLDVNEKDAVALATSLGEKHFGIVADVTNAESLKLAKDKILSKYGSIDVLVNNAAINDMFENPAMAAEKSKFENYSLDMWQKSLDVN